MHFNYKYISFFLFFTVFVYPEIKQPLAPLSEPATFANKKKRVIKYLAELTPHLNVDIEFTQAWFEQNNPILTCIVAKLLEKETNQLIGKIEFAYDHFHSDTGYITQLLILPEYRKKSYGSILLQFGIDTFTKWGCDKIKLEAQPFNLKDGESADVMLPKLIAFYKRHGAQLIAQNEFAADMMFYLKSAETIVNSAETIVNS